MSAKIAGLVWELDLPREHKYVLLCLSDHSDHDGNNVFPSIGLVAWKTGYSERRIQELMRNLEYRGLLVRMESQSGRGRTIRYRINLEAGVFRERPKKGARLSPFSRMTILRNSEIPQAKKGASGDEKGETAAAPESSRTRTIQSTPHRIKTFFGFSIGGGNRHAPLAGDPKFGDISKSVRQPLVFGDQPAGYPE